MAQTTPDAPTVDDLKDRDAAFRAAEGNDKRETLDAAVGALIAAEGIDAVNYSKTDTAVTATTESLELYARIDEVRDRLGVVQVNERATDEAITDDVDPSVLTNCEEVSQAVEEILAAQDAPAYERAW